MQDGEKLQTWNVQLPEEEIAAILGALSALEHTSELIIEEAAWLVDNSELSLLLPPKPHGQGVLSARVGHAEEVALAARLSYLGPEGSWSPTSIPQSQLLRRLVQIGQSFRLEDSAEASLDLYRGFLTDGAVFLDSNPKNHQVIVKRVDDGVRIRDLQWLYSPVPITEVGLSALLESEWVASDNCWKDLESYIARVSTPTEFGSSVLWLRIESITHLPISATLYGPQGNFISTGLYRYSEAGASDRPPELESRVQLCPEQQAIFLTASRVTARASTITPTLRVGPGSQLVDVRDPQRLRSFGIQTHNWPADLIPYLEVQSNPLAEANTAATVERSSSPTDPQSPLPAAVPYLCSAFLILILAFLIIRARRQH